MSRFFINVGLIPRSSAPGLLFFLSDLNELARSFEVSRQLYAWGSLPTPPRTQQLRGIGPIEIRNAAAVGISGGFRDDD